MTSDQKLLLRHSLLVAIGTTILNMVLYRVHWEPHLDKYYSTVCSRATLFQVILYALIIIPPFFIGYATRDFWQHTSTYQEQPRVYYLKRLILQVGDNDQASSSSVWSTLPNLNDLLQPEELSSPTIKSREVDFNRDGINDILQLNVHFANLRHSVHNFKLLLFFHVEFSVFSSVILQSLTYASQSWATPASKVWIGGELSLRQRVPFPASGRLNRYNTSLLNTSNQFADEYEISNILSRYNERNVTIVMDNPYIVWESGSNENFTLEMELRYPPLTVTYYPGFWQLVKFAWIQYMAILVVFWWVLSRVQSFVFQNQIILTVRRKKYKSH